MTNQVAERTATNVPGKKNRVTKVMMRMETVSCFVFCAIWCVLWLIFSILSADSCALFAKDSLAFVLRYCRMSFSCAAILICVLHVKSRPLTIFFLLPSTRSSSFVLSCCIRRSFSIPTMFASNRMISCSQSDLMAGGNSV